MRYFEQHMGDGAYGYMNDARQVVLYTSNGVEETNEVVLEPEVLEMIPEGFYDFGKQLFPRLVGELKHSVLYLLVSMKCSCKVMKELSDCFQHGRLGKMRNFTS